MKKPDYKKADDWGNGLLVLGVLLALVFQGLEEGRSAIVVIIIAVLCAMGGIALRLAFYRCPACRGLLPLNSARPDYCPHCGEKLP